MNLTDFQLGMIVGATIALLGVLVGNTLFMARRYRR